MHNDIGSPIKHREVRFTEVHADPQQALSASLLLGDIDGVITVHPQTPQLLRISYDINYITLDLIEALLYEEGFHLDGSLLCRLKRALYYYSEEIERNNLGICDDCNKQVFISRYQRLKHGCRDRRPEHWRNYR